MWVEIPSRYSTPKLSLYSSLLGWTGAHRCPQWLLHHEGNGLHTHIVRGGNNTHGHGRDAIWLHGCESLQDIHCLQHISMLPESSLTCILLFLPLSRSSLPPFRLSHLLTLTLGSTIAGQPMRPLPGCVFAALVP